MSKRAESHHAFLQWLRAQLHSEALEIQLPARAAAFKQKKFAATFGSIEAWILSAA
eukprot:m.163720 g.163720  ORF g.163720 m.163720 type:complete len:56 (+) comp15217_c1_seq3:787-954(+)